MRPLTKAVLAAVWTGALILTVVVAVDGQEHARYEHQAREDTRTQMEVVRADLAEALESRAAMSDRLAAFVDISPGLDPERYQGYAGSLAASQPGVRSLRLVPATGTPLVYPAGADGAGLAALGNGGASLDPRIAGPYPLESGAQALVLAKPVYRYGSTPVETGQVWGTALVEFYLEPVLGEAKVTGWPGDARFSLRGSDGHGESGAVFYGDSGIFSDSPVTSIVAFQGGQWQIAATPVDGWPQESPSSWWIRIGGGILALLASVLVGVLVSEPTRLRSAVHMATRSAQENEARFRSVSDSAQDAIVTVDSRDTVTYANRAAETLYGLRRKDLVGRPVGMVLPTEARILKECGRGDHSHPTSVELLSEQRDGTRVPVELSTATWTVAGEEFRTAIIRDVTDRKRAQEEQARLAAILDTTPDFVAIADPQGRLEYVNRAARHVLGLDDEALADRALVDLFPENIRRTFQAESMPAALRTGAWRGESLLLGANGRRVPVSEVLLARHDDTGQLTAVALLARDMSEERRAQDELQREKERFRTLSEAAFEGIIIHENGKILEVNNAFALMTGRTREELMGHDIIELVAPEARAATVERLRHPRETPYELEVLRGDGERFPAEVAAKHFPYKDRVVRVVAVRDITERKKAEAAQRVALERLSEIERLKEIDQFKTQLLNTASHELNTPITPIRLQLHLLKNARLGDLSDKHRRAVDVLDRNVERLALLVQDVLDVARLQSGRLKVNRSPLELETLIREAAESFEEPAKHGKVLLKTEVTDDLWVVGDGHRLTQVLFNLLSNALKFTPQDGTIMVQVREEAGRAVVRVTDSGEGLTAEQMQRLFKPFSQVHDTMQTTRAGTGLGLYISKGIVEEHEGTIWCDSEGPGKGSTFGFSIPLASPDELRSGEPDAPVGRIARTDR